MNAYMNGSAAININKSKPKFDVLDGYLDVSARSYAMDVPSYGLNSTNLNTHSTHTRKLHDTIAFLALATIVVVACVHATLGFIETSQIRSASMESLQTVEMNVHAGESLWSLAEQNPIEGFTTQEVVQIIRDINQLETSMLQPGQTILLPQVLQ